MTEEVSYKWAPIIERDACSGCGECVKACQPKCIELVWDFATFKRSADCDSCGKCADACQHDVIHMGWVQMTANHDVGRWCDIPKQTPLPKRRLFGFLRL